MTIIYWRAYRQQINVIAEASNKIQKVKSHFDDMFVSNNCLRPGFPLHPVEQLGTGFWSVFPPEIILFRQVTNLVCVTQVLTVMRWYR